MVIFTCHLARPQHPDIWSNIILYVSMKVLFRCGFSRLILFLVVLGLCCCMRAFSSFSKRRVPFVAIMVFSLWWLFLWSTGFRWVGSVVVAHELCSPEACGIFLDWGSNPCPLHRQADSYPLYHQGSPRCDLNLNQYTLSKADCPP